MTYPTTGPATWFVTGTSRGLGLELDGALPLGFCDIEQLSISLVGLSFPVDLSGGVARFRHRRGALERLRSSEAQ